MKTICDSTLRIIFVLALFCNLTEEFANGQDIIIQKNGEEIKAKVDQVLDTEIKYRMFDNLNGPVYSIKKAEVFMIRYENGIKDLLMTKPGTDISQNKTGPASKVSFTEKDIKPAKTAAIIDYAIIAPIMALGAISAFTGDDDLSFGAGAGATIIAGVGIPISRLFAAKTRRLTGVEGYPVLRVAGWVGYGLTMTDAIAMLALSQDVDFGAELILSAAILGSLSSALMAIDAGKTSHQAQSLQSSINLQPMVGYVRDMEGNRYNTIGLRINF